MATPAELRQLLEATLADLSSSPDAGKGTATTVATWTSGVACRIDDGRWRLVADEMEFDGGFGLGPDPGVFARASLAACLVAGYVFFAALRDIEITALKVTVEGDYNARAMFGLEDETPPGFSEVRYRVEVASRSAADDVTAMLDYADRYSSILDVFKRAVPVKRDLSISSPTS